MQRHIQIPTILIATANVSRCDCRRAQVLRGGGKGEVGYAKGCEGWDMLEGIGITFHPDLKRSTATCPMQKQMKCLVSWVTQEPKFLPTTQCQVGLYFLSNSFLMQAAMSFSMLNFSRATFAQSIASCCISSFISACFITALRSAVDIINQIKQTRTPKMALKCGGGTVWRWGCREEGCLEGMEGFGREWGGLGVGAGMGVWGGVVRSSPAGGCGVVAGVSGSVSLPAVEFEPLLLQLLLHFNRHDATIPELQLRRGSGEGVGSAEELGLRGRVEWEAAFGVGEVGTEREVEVAGVPAREVVVLEAVQLEREVLQFVGEHSLREEEAVHHLLRVLLVHAITYYTIIHGNPPLHAILEKSYPLHYANITVVGKQCPSANYPRHDIPSITVIILTVIPSVPYEQYVMMRSYGCTLGQELSELYLGGQSLEHSLLEFRHELQHLEQSLPLDLFLHGEQHLVDGAHDVEHRVPLLVDIVHLPHRLVDASPLGQSQDRLDLLNGGGVADVEDELVGDGLALTGEVAGLDVVDGLTHVSISDELQGPEGLLGDLNSFSLDDTLEVEFYLLVLEFSEAEDDAATLDGLDDLGGGVAAEHEPSGLAVVADDHAQGMLRTLSEAVGLVQDDDLRPACPQCHLLLRKRLYLFAYHVNSTLVRSVQLQSCLLELPLQQLADDAEHTRCLTHPGRTRQDEIGDGALGHTGTESVDLLHVAEDLIESLGAVLFQPDLFHGANFIICPIRTAISPSKMVRLEWQAGMINLLGIIVLAIVILMMQGSEKQSANRLSPLFVDTEFVPTAFPFFALYHRRVSDIPGVLPYSPEQTFQQLQAKLTSSKLPSSSFASSIKDYKIQAYRKYIDGDELELGPDGAILQLSRQSEENESKDRCEICCVMLASQNEVLRLQIQRRQEKYMQEEILAELNHKYKSRLSIGDIRFNAISFSTSSLPGTPTSIIYDPTPVAKLSELILANERVSFVGIDIVTNRVSPSMLFNQEDQVVSVIDVDSGRLLRITDLKGGLFMLQFEKIKQYRVEEVLQIIGVQNAKAKGLKVMEKVFKPTEIIYTMNYLYDDNAFINFLEAVVVDQSEVFIESIKDLPLLSEGEFSILAKDQQGKMRWRMNCVGLFCSDFQMIPKKNCFRLSYHIINKYIRNYFTHSNNYITDTISARFTKGLYTELAQLSNFTGKVYRKVNFQLTHQKKDIIDFSGFIVTTTNQGLLSYCSDPLYSTRSTIVTIISKTGKIIGGESSFSNLQEVVFLPFTKFTVIDRTQSGKNIYLTLQQCIFETKQPISNLILWLQQSHEAKKIFQQKLQILPISIRLHRLETTQEFLDWIGKNQRYVQSESTNIIVITNMFRIQNDRENPNAGAEAIIAGRQRLPRAKYIVYIGNVANAVKVLASNKLNPEQLHVTNDPAELAGYLCNQFNAAVKRKKIAPPQAYRFPRQDWLDFFPQLLVQQQPLYSQGVQKIKPKQKEKNQVFGDKNPRSPEKQKEYYLPPIKQENKYEFSDNPPATAPKLINQPKPFLAPADPPKGPQYSKKAVNQPIKAHVSQPVKPVSFSYQQSQEQDPADRFNAQKGPTNKSETQSNLYELNPGVLTSKIGSSMMPLGSPRNGKP